MEKYLLVCDWGTSSFRLGLYQLASDSIINEVETEDGIAVVYKAWQDISNIKSIRREDLFRAVLKQQIVALSEKTAISLNNVAIVISGMASSSIGLFVVPYARLPFSLDGRGIAGKHFQKDEAFPHEIILISGVQSEHDVMRGEETQLLGIWHWLQNHHMQPATGVIIFPGTHSKHIYVHGKKMVNFKSFMTGEMFQLIGGYSILKDSIQLQKEEEPGADQLDAFSSGVSDSTQSGLLNSLFRVRTNQLFNRFSKTANAFYLSGLLIGTELQDLVNHPAEPLFLCCGKKLFRFYKKAMEELQLANRTSFISPEIAEQAAAIGQKIIYDQYINKKLFNG